jgi:hypothetical protein
VEGKGDGDDIPDTGKDVSSATSHSDGREHSLDDSGVAVERPDTSDGERPDSDNASDEGTDVTASDQGEGDAGNRLIGEVTHEALEMLISSGPVPNAVDFYQYNADDRERLMRMAEAPRTDESDRRTMLAQAQTVVIKRAQWIQAALFGGCIAAAAVSFWIFDTGWGGLFLGLPVMQGIGAIVKSARGDD